MKSFTNIFFATVILLTGFCFTSNGQTWSTVGTGINNNWGRVESMCEYNGDLYVGGYFDNMGGLQVKSLAKWNGTAWDSVPGMTSFGDLEIFDMVVYHNELVIVGSAIHKWNGTSWSNVGGWVDNKQFAVEVYNDELYITGHFEHADGIPTRGIAKWNGLAWDSVGGPGLNLSLGFTGYALQAYDGELYLGGGFYLVNGLPVHSIARWNGAVWDSVGTISEQWAFQSLCEYNNKLYAGGKMTINNNPANHWITRWNSTAWDSVGLGLNYVPSNMIVYNNELYAAGDFDTAGSVQSLGIARWNDSQWSTVGSGLDLFHINQDTIISPIDTSYYAREHIYSMGTYNNELYVGGIFSMIGGINANSIAKWHIVGASINEPNNSWSVLIYPNPASDYLTVVLPIDIPKTEIKIYNMLGELESSLTTKNQKTNIDVSNMTGGVHIVQISTGDKIVRQKLIKH